MKTTLRQVLESFNGQPQQTRYSILGAVLLAFFLLDVCGLILPQAGSIMRVQDQIKTLSGQTLEARNNKQRIGQLQKNLTQTRLRYEELNNRLRSLQEVPNILAVISRIAYDHGVKVDKLTPQKNQQESLKTALSGHFYMLPVAAAFRGSYHRFGRFLNKLEGENFYFLIKNMVVVNDEQFPNMRLFSLTFNLVLLE